MLNYSYFKFESNSSTYTQSILQIVSDALALALSVHVGNKIPPSTRVKLFQILIIHKYH